MKLQIRQGVFESNSSSAHSIVVTRDDRYVDPDDFREGHGPERIYINSKGIWDIAWDADELSFGRYPMDLLTTVADKARYVFADYCGYQDGKKADKILEVLKKVVPGLKGIRFPQRTEDVYEHEDGTMVPSDINIHSDWSDDLRYYYIKDGKEIPVKVSEKYSRTEDNYGYVDHQSQGIIEGFLKHQGITLEEFLTNHKYVIVIDGDEYGFWEKFKYAGLIDIDNIESEFSAV